MPKSENQKLKLLYLAKIFQEKTDEDHGITMIEGLASNYDAKELQRQVVVNECIKTMNESIYYNVDKLNTAINHNSAIDFKYYERNVHKKLVLRPNGDKTDISPWALLWDNENYYMVAYDEKTG